MLLLLIRCPGSPLRGGDNPADTGLKRERKSHTDRERELSQQR